MLNSTVHNCIDFMSREIFNRVKHLKKENAGNRQRQDEKTWCSLSSSSDHQHLKKWKKKQTTTHRFNLFTFPYSFSPLMKFLQLGLRWIHVQNVSICTRPELHSLHIHPNDNLYRTVFCHHLSHHMQTNTHISSASGKWPQFFSSPMSKQNLYIFHFITKHRTRQTPCCPSGRRGEPCHFPCIVIFFVCASFCVHCVNGSRRKDWSGYPLSWMGSVETASSKLYSFFCSFEYIL